MCFFMIFYGLGCSNDLNDLEVGNLGKVNNYKLSSNNLAVVIDAGSGGSTMEIIKYNGLNSSESTEKLFSSNKTASAVSSLESDQEKITEHIKELVDQAKGAGKDLTGIPVYFLATAGMRNMGEVSQVKTLEAVKKAIKDLGLSLGDARVISGADEGLYAWISLNFMDGHIPNNLETKGIIEVGGASAQLVFVPTETKPKSNIFSLELKQNKYDLYSYSSNQHGQNEAESLFGDDSSCETANNLAKPFSTYQNCVDSLIKKMGKLISKCPGDCLHWTKTAAQPKISNGQKFYAAGMVKSVKNDFVQASEISISELDSSGAIACKEPPKEIIKQLPIKNQKFAGGACFQVSLVKALLYGNGSKYLGFGLKEASIAFDKKFSWPQGFVIFHSSGFKISHML